MLTKFSVVVLGLTMLASCAGGLPQGDSGEALRWLDRTHGSPKG